MKGDLGTADCVGNDDKRQQVYERVRELEQSTRRVTNAEELEAREREIRACTDALASFLLERHVQAGPDAEEQPEKEAELIGSRPQKLKKEGCEIVRIRTTGGLCISVRVRYYRRPCKRRRGRRQGVHAGLVLPGIDERCTPGSGALISARSALLSSFEEVRRVLLEHGVKPGSKGVRQLAYRYAERARVVQQAGDSASEPGETLAGRRVVVSVDGGRVRLRENKRGRKTAEGRRHYQGAWREPKLFIVYIVDEQGKPEESFAPLIDAGLRGPDAVFALLRGYLQRLALEQADQVLFVADGAHWIWKRVPGPVKASGPNPGRVHELIDFHHAVKHSGKVAALRKSGSLKQRKARVRKAAAVALRRADRAGGRGGAGHCRGRYGKAITTERNDFVRNQHRTAYPKLKALQLPVGSGAVESAIRRVVNLRLKGPCIFWYRENAEKMLMLRAYYKSGRWNLLKRMANSHLSLLAA